MKKIIPILTISTIAVLMVACNNRPVASTGKVLTYSDTTGLAEFQQWKAQNELTPSATYSRGQEVVTTTRPVIIKKYYTRPAAKKIVYRNSGSMSSTSSYPAKARRRGWSKAAKGTAIGAGSGAILGALINKRNRGVGAVIGGLLGGGAGFGIGRGMDRKDGRY
jgi:thiamine pyrophosphate-dependent acetolactate synthase large subunit-like protein